MNEKITVIFDANGGGITVSSKRVTVGEPYGELPPPSRFGYTFDGWFTSEDGGELIDADTIVSEGTSRALYAHWTKNVYVDEKLKAYRKKKANLKRQKIAIIVSAVLMVLVIIALAVVAHIVNRTNLEDVDGTVYKIIKKNDTYILCYSESEIELDMSEDGKYYVTDAGSQIKLDTSTGKASIYAYVDTVGAEVVGNIVTARILAFPQVEKAEMTRLEVHNDYGTYAFIGTHTNGQNNYYIEGHKSTSYNQEQFASLIVSCGYVLAMSKIENPVKDANGELSDYGLVAQTRIDANGDEYTYTPAWYELTDVNNQTYKVIVGDKIASSAGYYVQYLNPKYPDTPFVYIVNSDIEKTVLSPVEALVEPMIVYPMSLSTYFNVEDFTVINEETDSEVSFTFLPLEKRMGTMQQNMPYVFNTDEMKMFNPHSTNIDSCLQSFLNLSYVEVTKLNPDDEALITYGLSKPAYGIYYKFLVDDDDYQGTVEHVLFVSKLTSYGTYYVYSTLTDMIVQIERRYLPFLDYEFTDWVDETAYGFNLGCTNSMSFRNGNDVIYYDIDNSETEQFKFTAITDSKYAALDYNGKKTVNYFLVKENNKYKVVAKTTDGDELRKFKENADYYLSPDGKLYLIENKDLFALDTKSGKTGKCTLYVASYDKNTDSVLYFFVDNATGSWGRVARTLGSANVKAYATKNNEKTVTVDTTHFRHLFQTLLYASIEGECKLTDEEKEAYRKLSDNENELTLIISTEQGDYTFRFYRYTERKSYITINGSGSYYMLSDRVEKLWNDACKVLAGEDVTATAKN